MSVRRTDIQSESRTDIDRNAVPTSLEYAPATLVRFKTHASLLYATVEAALVISSSHACSDSIAASLYPSSYPVRRLRRWVEFTQYVCIRYTERLAEAGIEPSVGSVGDSYDNALAESIIGLYKTEVIHRRGQWRSIDAVEFATLEWVHWFNNHRLLEPIGYVPPAEHEAAYYAQLQDANESAVMA